MPLISRGSDRIYWPGRHGDKSAQAEVNKADLTDLKPWSRHGDVRDVIVYLVATEAAYVIWWLWLEVAVVAGQKYPEYH